PAIAISNCPVCKPGIIPSKFVVSKLISNPASSATAWMRSISKPTYSPSSLNSNGTNDVSLTTVYSSSNESSSAPLAESSSPQADNPNTINSDTHKVAINFHCFFNINERSSLNYS